MDEWAAMDDCDCSPPPEFLIPPPPRPPLFAALSCSEDPIPDIETCDALPLLDPSYRSSPSLDTPAIIAVGSVLLSVTIVIVVVLACKHKRKVQNLFPCKGSQGSRDCSGPPVYEDLTNLRPAVHHHHQTNLIPKRLASMEQLEPRASLPLHHLHHHHLHHHHQPPHQFPNYPVYPCSPGPDPYSSQDVYNPVYEEISDADSEPQALSSEDEFAEDELSVGEPERRPPPPPYYQRTTTARIQNHPHGTLYLSRLPSPCPYETVPVLNALAAYRPTPKPHSQDSAFGSDSGYSNHTCRRDPRRLSQLSADFETN